MALETDRVPDCMSAKSLLYSSTVNFVRRQLLAVVGRPTQFSAAPSTAVLPECSASQVHLLAVREPKANLTDSVKPFMADVMIVGDSADWSTSTPMTLPLAASAAAVALK